MKETTIVPQINQIEVHPYFNQQDVQDYCENMILLLQLDATYEKSRIIR